MLFLSSLLENLSYGPLSELSIAGKGSGVIPEESLPKLMVRINAALMSLYARFPIHQRIVVLETVEGITTYHLRAQYAQSSNSDEVHKYLKDSSENLFTGDLTTIDEVLDDNLCPLPLNDRRQDCSWHTPEPDTLSWAHPVTGERFHIRYRGKHTTLPLVPTDPELIQVRIPATLHTALLNHVAGNIYLSMSMETALAKGTAFLQAYETECAFLEERNLLLTANTDTNIKPCLGGWR